MKSAVHCEELVQFGLQAAEASFQYMELSITVLPCQRGKKCRNSLCLVVVVPKLVNELTDFSHWLKSNFDFDSQNSAQLELMFGFSCVGVQMMVFIFVQLLSSLVNVNSLCNLPGCALKVPSSQ
jgi:hypothetical protein